MMFKLFSPREMPYQTSSKRSGFDERYVNAERTVLTHALHLLLQALPQAYSGRENIKRLCQTILNATPHMRLVWVGFADGGSDQVEPYVTAGDSGARVGGLASAAALFRYQCAVFTELPGRQRAGRNAQSAVLALAK
jgi:hypothetical protein